MFYYPTLHFPHKVCILHYLVLLVYALWSPLLLYFSYASTVPQVLHPPRTTPLSVTSLYARVSLSSSKPISAKLIHSSPFNSSGPYCSQSFPHIILCKTHSLHRVSSIILNKNGLEIVGLSTNNKIFFIELN